MARRDPVVPVKQGLVRGSVEENVYGGEFLAFRGLPYARPPTGPFRFKDPQPPTSWTGVRDCTKFGGICAQMDLLVRDIIGDDDCLYLNVYTPTIEPGSKRAVMVWIHGGGFMYGNGNSDIYGPDYLIRKDIVLVTINYRVGILGFLNLENEIAPGNQGLKDQVMALRWVKDNISNFGGDPDNVTIFGESAGGASVHYLSISPLVEQGLFHKAIAQSGVALNPWAYVTKKPASYAFKVAACLGKQITDTQELYEFLIAADARQLVKAQLTVLKQEGSHVLIGTFGPSIDDKSPNPFLPQHPAIMAKDGVKVPFLLGYNDNEGSLFVGNIAKVLGKVNNDFKQVVHPEIEEELNKEGITHQFLKQLYFADKPIDEGTMQLYADYMSDMMFIRGIYDVLRYQTEKNVTTYLYKFCYDKEFSLMKTQCKMSLPGATHADDLACLFYPYLIKNFGMTVPQPGTKDYDVIEYFTQMWTDFAKTGNPTPMTTKLITELWKPIQKGDVYDYMEINEKIRMESIKPAESIFNWKGMKNKL
ncbi:Esterase FE4 [Dufourea novaeangliae]|uniref:Carboxylic ester hydrolase n=1 Tax=Dufourea novaeangliae TaxID=178035 RepID=A0A154PPD2_DUFNO|nr:Esterase FE4 [Dufourea novaeangliae]